MKPKIAKFCELIAVGGMNQTECALAVGYAKKRAVGQASRLLTREDVKEEIKRLQDKYAIDSTTEAKWIREQLKDVIAKSSQAVEVMQKVDGEMVGTGEYKYDSPGVNKAIDILNRMNGGYERDNNQKQAVVSFKMDLSGE